MTRFFILILAIFVTNCSIDTSKDNSDELTNNDPSNDEVTQPEVIDYSEVSCDATYNLPITAASSDDSNSATINKLIDGDKTNLSHWTPSSSQNSVVFTLNENALIKEFVISWLDNSNQHNFDISTSFDGEDWQSMATAIESSKNYVIADRINLANTAQTGRYIKLQLHGDENNDASGIIEFEAFGCTTSVGHNIELIDWYLSVQTDEDGNGKSDSIKETTLADGYFDPRFFYTSADKGLVFTSSVKGYRTSTNTKYVRSELREMLRRGNDSHKTQGVNKNNWVFSSAPTTDLNNAGGIDGTLDVEVAVNKVTTTGDAYQIGRVIIGQIHANDDEPVRLYYRKLPNNSRGSIYISHEYLDGDDSYYELIGSRSDNASDPSNGIALNEKFAYQIKVIGNQLTVTITTSDNQTYSQVVDMSNSRYDQGGQYMYFKAGVYNQNNSGDLHDYVQATFYKIDNAHDQYQF